MRVNLQRLLENLDRYSQIGRVDEVGVERIALSEEDKEARDLLKSQMGAAGLAVKVDELGNMIGMRKGKLDVPPVAFGSHLDTVYKGGRFDGALGVIAGLEVIHSLNDAGITTDKPLALINFTNEEGVRFAPDMMGSHVYSGQASVEEIWQSTAYDNPNDTVKSRLEAIGYLSEMKAGSMALDSFLELHIEQGPTLETDGVDIGAVNQVQGIYWTRYTIRGQANHAGTTPITYRKDAGYAAAQVMQYIGDYPRQQDDRVLTTVGTIRFEPNAVNIVPEEASLTLDLRSVHKEALAGAQQQIDAFIDETIKSADLSLEKEEMVRFTPVALSETVVDVVRVEAEKLQLTVRTMPSGAGHDAQMMAAICPTAMIFVPSVNGISHNVQELTLNHDLENGANVLLNSILAQAKARL